LFVNLIQAFATAKTRSSVSAFYVLRFGAPEGLVDVIHPVHKKFKLKFALKKLEASHH
jgi:hypothetical protein